MVSLAQRAPSAGTVRMRDIPPEAGPGMKRGGGGGGLQMPRGSDAGRAQALSAAAFDADSRRPRTAEFRGFFFVSFLNPVRYRPSLPVANTALRACIILFLRGRWFIVKHTAGLLPEKQYPTPTAESRPNSGGPRGGLRSSSASRSHTFALQLRRNCRRI
jgi:hypothetical protein